MTVSLCIPTTALTFQLLATVNNFYLAAPLGSQVVIVFDGPPPPSDMLESLNALADDLSLTVLESREGPAHARNVAASLATGDSLVFADSDVVVPASVFATLASVSTGTVRVPATLPIPLRKNPRGRSSARFANRSSAFFSDFALAPKVVDGKTLPVSACFSIRKQDFWSVEGFDESFKFPAGEDWDFFTRLQNANVKIEFDKSIRVFHRNPRTHWGIAKRSFRYARHGALATQSDAIPSTSAEMSKPVRTGTVLYLPAIVITGTLKILCVGLSVGEDKLASHARHLDRYQENTQQALSPELSASPNVPHWLMNLNRRTLFLLDTLKEFPITSPWDPVVPVRDDITSKTKRGYRLLVLVWTVSYILGYMVRERAAKRTRQQRMRS